MCVQVTLKSHLTSWAGDDAQKRAVAATIEKLAAAGTEIARLIHFGPLAGDLAEMRGESAHGEAQKTLDLLTHDIVLRALKASKVAWMGSEEADGPIMINEIEEAGPLVVNVDPLDGSTNIDTNVSIGTIFSILPNVGENPLLQPGRNQLAAGYIIYGPQTAIVLTVGQGTDIFWLDQRLGEYVLCRQGVQVPATSREYAINTSYFRHWDDAIKAYVLDCKMGADGPRKADFNMRWIGSLVADAFRILTRGGIYLYPGNSRPGYANGRLRLLYEANPIAMIMEQAGAACTNGTERMLDLVPASLHQRVPLIFGSKTEVEEVAHYYREPHSLGDRSPLFGSRGLFRTIPTSN